VGKTAVKPKTKSKVKARLHGGKKQPLSSDLKKSSGEIKLPQEISASYHKVHWVLAIILILLAGLVWYLSQSWAIQSSFSQAVTYPKVSVLGVNVGNLSTSQLDDKLAGMKTEFESKKVTLINGKKQWVFDAGQIGSTFDAVATSQTIWELNKLSMIDKFHLMAGGISSDVKPTILVDSKTCVKSLAVIPATQIKPKNAFFYFDQSVKIQPDKSGSKFNATLTCQDLTKLLANDSFVTDVSLDTIPASITKTDLQPKLKQVQSMVGKSITLKSDSGSYLHTWSSKQLFSLLNIAKKGKDIQVSWSSSKLGDIVNDIASKVNTYESAPPLETCQYVASSGGYWLDTVATKKIFTDLGADSAGSYDLSIVYSKTIVADRRSVKFGNSGTIYLTFDDGMTYADQIMDYADCYGVKVTFFEIGGRVSGDAPQLRRAIAEGDTVQSHGFYHAMYDYGDRTYDWQYNDMKHSIREIMSVTGVRPTYFRPPGGNRSDNTYKAAAANGLKLILWDDSSADATGGGISSAQTCANVLAGAYPGASVLMHSIKWTTANAVPCIIEGLAAMGYNMQALY